MLRALLLFLLTLALARRLSVGLATTAVWRKLEEQNPEFFKAYNVRIILKDQIMAFNSLVQHQQAMARRQLAMARQLATAGRQAIHPDTRPATDMRRRRPPGRAPAR